MNSYDNSQAQYVQPVQKKKSLSALIPVMAVVLVIAVVACIVAAVVGSNPAVKVGRAIKASIRAAEANHGGKTTGYTVPNPKAQADATLRALQRAGIRADTVNYVEAHGTGTALGDPIEVNSLTSARPIITPPSSKA